MLSFITIVLADDVKGCMTSQAALGPELGAPIRRAGSVPA
jgi:hypothetical protein